MRSILLAAMAAFFLLPTDQAVARKHHNPATEKLRVADQTHFCGDRYGACAAGSLVTEQKAKARRIVRDASKRSRELHRSAKTVSRETRAASRAPTAVPAAFSGPVIDGEPDFDKPRPLAELVTKARQYVGKTAGQLGLPNSLWCSDFVNMITGGGTHDRMARSWLDRPKLDRPQIGAVVVFSRGRSDVYGHVGVLSGFDRHGNPIAITGNSSGNRVREGRYPKGRVLAYVVPPSPALLEAGGPWVDRASG